ncbi:immunoglobulin I-set domain protein [Teladorsagia circumcincta]|uniref:Immunoglobulin I-set domain protein n=1 Tax=Teladorsagia circumcincta TaxID=45464 RepID=A0A2G9V2U1_TELCI|nr:immunoglobulin I-set domain protein [Teladorsagia circumcincta]
MMVAMYISAVPSAPEGPLVVSTTGKSWKLSWSAPLEDGHSEILGYYIEKYDEKLKKWMFLARCIDNIYTVDGLPLGSSQRFRVSAENAVGRGSSIESKRVKSSAETPSFVNKPGNMVVVKGTKFKVTVEFSGFPLPEVRWMRNRKEIFSGARQWTETSNGVSSLSIAEIRDEDEGEYTVELRNVVGMCEHKFKLNMDAQPEIIRPDRYMSSLIYDEGDTVKLRLSFTVCDFVEPTVSFHGFVALPLERLKAVNTKLIAHHEVGGALQAVADGRGSG